MKPYSQQFPKSSFVVRDGFVIVTEFSGNNYMREVKIPLLEFIKASRVITAKEEA